MAVQAVSGGRQGVRLIRLAHEQPGSIHAAARAQSVADRHETRRQSEARAPSGVGGSEAEERSKDEAVERILATRAMSWGTIDPYPRGSTSRKTLELIR
jgi:hypothetical protein